MRATEIVRSILDLLDNIEQQDIEKPTAEPGEQNRRFKQIFAMLDSDSNTDYSNTPNEVVADVDSVTTDAGGGVNGQKHPADIRVKDPRGFE